MSHQLHQARVYQYPRADAIKHALDDQSRLRARRVGPPDPQPHRHRHRRRQTIPDCEQVRRPPPRSRPWRGRQPRPETEAFKRLVEDKYDVEGDKFRPRNRQGEADEDGVEDDAELEDANCRHLRRVVFDFVRRGLDDG